MSVDFATAAPDGQSVNNDGKIVIKLSGDEPSNVFNPVRKLSYELSNDGSVVKSGKINLGASMPSNSGQGIYDTWYRLNDLPVTPNSKLTLTYIRTNLPGEQTVVLDGLRRENRMPSPSEQQAFRLPYRKKAASN